MSLKVKHRDVIMNENRPIVLLYPPPSDPTQPYSSLPTLTGFLRNQGFRVIQRDLGIELLDELLTPEILIRARDAAVIREKNSNGSLEEKYLERFYGIIGLSDYIIENVVEAKSLMRDKKLFYDLNRYKWAVRILQLACDLVSLPYHPTFLKISKYESDGDLTLQGLLETTSKKTDNMFFEIFKQKIVPQILAMNPLLVGISITYDFQIVPAFTLSRLLKIAAPELHVNIGGAIIYSMESHLLNDSICFNFADSFVVGEGETALLTLATNLLLGKDLRSVPNLISRINGLPYAYNLHFYEDVNSLSCPDFDGLKLDQYLSPEPVLPISSTRGCYYGKCAFCDVSMNTRRIYRQVKGGRISADVTKLYQKYGAKRFFFCDDAMPPVHMQEISRLIKEKLHDITWEAEARFEKTITPEFVSILKNGGCRMLIFGLESASQRVLDAMNKNNLVENDMTILKACSVNGIAVNLQAFIGFPSETREEAWETIDFLVNNEYDIASMGLEIFSLFKDTPVYKEPQNFKISNISTSKKDRLVNQFFDYVPLSGMTPEDTKKEHKLANEKLNSIYSTRSSFLSGPVCPHSLLYFSHYKYNEIRHIWEMIDASKNISTSQGSHNMDDLVLTRSKTLIFSCPSDKELTFNYRVLCSQTGKLYYLSPRGRKLLELFDGKHTVSEITSLWVAEQSKEFDEQVLLLVEAFTMIKQFLRNSLVTG